MNQESQNRTVTINSFTKSFDQNETKQNQERHLWNKSIDRTERKILRNRHLSCYCDM